jgi:hypothetical protein
VKTNTYLQSLENKNLLGMTEFMLNQKYTYTIESASVCYLYRIQKHSFLEIFEQKRFIKAKVKSHIYFLLLVKTKRTLNQNVIIK